MQNVINQKKCEHCSNWTDGNRAFCEHCGEILDYKYRKEIHELEKKQENEPVLMKFIKIKNSDKNIFLFLIEKIIRGGQALVLGIIALVTLLLLALPG